MISAMPGTAVPARTRRKYWAQSSDTPGRLPTSNDQNLWVTFGEAA